MARIGNIGAVLFDMDGTLVDSEVLTEPVIMVYCHEAGVDVPDLDFAGLCGISWIEVAERLARDCPALPGVDTITQRLHEIFVRQCTEHPPAPIPGARQAMIAAHGRMPTGIVSSSHRESIDLTIRQLDIEAFVTCRVGAEDYAASKPAPDAYRLAADILDVPAASCLVFEDSLAGVQSARAAGMPVIAITHHSNIASEASKLADRAITDFGCLEPEFFERIQANAERK